MTSKWFIRRAKTPSDVARCLSVREAVFIREQGVSAELERDGRDGSAIHFLASDDDKVLATARVRLLDGKFKFERVAVLGEARGTGLGRALMAFMMNDLAAMDEAEGRHFFLSSQVSAIPFYEKLGFTVCSDVYMDADIEHRDMERSATPL